MRLHVIAVVALATCLTPAAARGALVYQRGPDEDDGTSIVSARSNGAHPIVVAHGYGPSLSPDGKLVAYFRGEGAEELYVESVRGGPARRLVAAAALTGARTAWSPDSRRLAVACHVTQSCLVSLSGKRRVLSETYYFTAAAFSPDGDWIVVEKDLECDYCYGDLFAYRADAPGERSMGEGWSPVWAEPGLAFGRDDGVFLRPRVGARAQRLFQDARPVAWSADGGRLLVAKPLSGSGPHWKYRAVVLRPGHGAPIQVPYTFRDVSDLSRDGREILGERPGGGIVRVAPDGSVRVLVPRGRRPDWVH